jgi:hypothetical protein
MSQQAAKSVKIDIPFGRRQIRIFLGAFEELVEFLFEHLAVCLFGLELFPEDLFAAGAFPFKLGHLRSQIGDGGRLLRDRVSDYRSGFRIDFQDRLAARAWDLEHPFRHITIVNEDTKTGEPGAPSAPQKDQAQEKMIVRKF